jgi:tripartite-type tricarboxylate transporter receptor subunit TctC
MKKRLLVLLMVFLTTICGLWAGGNGETAAGGSDWPKKTIQAIVPFSPGGDCDFNGRAYATRLGSILGQTVVVTNVTGNNGAIGATQVKNSAPDGYTVLFYHSALSVGRVFGTMDFGIDSFDLAVVGGKDAGYAVCVNAKGPYQNLKDLVTASQKNPGKITFAAPTASVTYVTGMLLNKAGAKLNLVDLGGAAERTAGLLGGHVDSIPNPLGAAVPYIQSGDWRALAILGAERNSIYTDVPTAAEAGYPGVEFSIYYFFAFPKGTPKEIVDKFVNACRKVFEMPDYRTTILDTYQQKPFFLQGKEASDLLLKQEAEIRVIKKDLVN